MCPMWVRTGHNIAHDLVVEKVPGGMVMHDNPALESVAHDVLLHHRVRVPPDLHRHGAQNKPRSAVAIACKTIAWTKLP